MITNPSSVLTLAVAILLSVSQASAASYADHVVSYDPGIGSVPRFDHPETALGEPSRLNPFGEVTDPFNPPYGTNQIVSLGAGGHLVLSFPHPVLNHPNNLHGFDFTIFGNAGFVITNEFDFTTLDWVGVPATDGSLFGTAVGDHLVSVSRNGRDFFLLDPMLAPRLDGFPPTDAFGSFGIPIEPRSSAQDFAGTTLDEMRQLYGGSAGGASFDVSWALDEIGQSIFLPEVRYIRIDVLSGRLEIDAVATVERNPRSHATRTRARVSDGSPIEAQR